MLYTEFRNWRSLILPNIIGYVSLCHHFVMTLLCSFTWCAEWEPWINGIVLPLIKKTPFPWCFERQSSLTGYKVDFPWWFTYPCLFPLIVYKSPYPDSSHDPLAWLAICLPWHKKWGVTFVAWQLMMFGRLFWNNK